jgi:hypothetical protein
LLLTIGPVAVSSALGAEPVALVVEPAELTSRADLLGRMVAVDDRVGRFQWHNNPSTTTPDRPYDEIYLKRTPVVFRLPPRLRYETAPRAAAARIEGVLRREGNELVCDVTAVDLFPTDLERVQRAVALLDPRDAERRVGWARWAERRARAFARAGDNAEAPLLEQARRLEGEAILIEADVRPGADPPRRWLELAHRARQRAIPEPEPGALAHRALAARLAAAATGAGTADLEALVKDIEEFFPASAAPPAGDVDLARWMEPYGNDPAGTYRIATEPVRAALDHRLWADATQLLLERRIAAEPQRGLELAQAAAGPLRDRPQVVQRLIEQAVRESSRDLTALRQADALELARVYREVLHQPDRARDLLRRWLDDQRNRRLSATDAEGRVLLAQQYDALLGAGARDTAVELLRDAWRIDPQSREVAEAFRRFGYRKVNDQWVESPQQAEADSTASISGALPTATDAPAAAAAPATTALRGLTPQQVRARLGGKPDHIVRTATQGQLLEQWIYRGVDQDQFVNFLHTPGDLLPKVVAYYARPRWHNDRSRPR